MRIEEYNATVPKRLSQFINASGMKQYAIARKAGLKPQELTDIIANRRIIKINELVALAKALNVNVGELIEGAPVNQRVG